tara:strand:- start:53 stop:451 length:399 start_codon:yes stop_codon:yes gene_type:complete
MEELKNKNNFKLPSNKTFGFFFTFVFLILGIYFVDKKILSYVFFGISIFLLLISLFSSKNLKILNFLWMKFGLFLGSIISPIIMGIIYYLLITPISMIMRVFGLDSLNLRKKNKKTYWIKRSSKINSMKQLY